MTMMDMKNLRTIRSMRSSETERAMNELALFAGAGGGILGGVLLGWRTVCAVEIDQYARRVLLARQNDGCLQPFPVFDDVRSFDGTKWRGRVDIITGGFPCQDISCAGKGAGITGERSGLWKEFARIIGEVRPRYALIENSPMLVIRGLDTVLCDLAEMGYDARWGVVGAHNSGAPHKRDRIWILAYTKGNGIGRESQDVRCEDGRQDREMCRELIGAGEESPDMANAISLRELQPQGSKQDKRQRAIHDSRRERERERQAACQRQKRGIGE
jgi:DNA (cytosine-5)-methyltransferase 1